MRLSSSYKDVDAYKDTDEKKKKRFTHNIMALIHHIKKLAHIKRFTHNIMTLHHIKKIAHIKKLTHIKSFTHNIMT